MEENGEKERAEIRWGRVVEKVWKEIRGSQDETMSKGEFVLMTSHAIVVEPLTSHPYKARTECTELSSDQAHIDE